MIVQGVTTAFITEPEIADPDPILSEANSLTCFQSDTNSTHEAKPFELVDIMADKGKAPILRHQYKVDSQQTNLMPATLVLSFDISRMSMLENVCASWPGPISAAVYLPLVAGNASNAQTVKDTQVLLSELASRWGCLRSMHCNSAQQQIGDQHTEHVASVKSITEHVYAVYLHIFISLHCKVLSLQAAVQLSSTQKLKHFARFVTVETALSMTME